MKTHNIVITTSAKNCLLDIFEYIALDSLDRAETFIDEMVESLSNTLSIFPLAGKIYNDAYFDFELRSLAYKKYVCFYRLKNDTVEILFVFNSAQNIQNLLGSMGSIGSLDL